MFIYVKIIKKKFYERTDGQPKIIIRNLTKMKFKVSIDKGLRYSFQPWNLQTTTKPTSNILRFGWLSLSTPGWSQWPRSCRFHSERTRAWRSTSWAAARRQRCPSRRPSPRRTSDWSPWSRAERGRARRSFCRWCGRWRRAPSDSPRSRSWPGTRRRCRTFVCRRYIGRWRRPWPRTYVHSERRTWGSQMDLLCCKQLLQMEKISVFIRREKKEKGKWHVFFSIRPLSFLFFLNQNRSANII